MQPELLEALAGEVAVILQGALAPVLVRLAAAEGRLATLVELRDRVVTVEAKTGLPAPPDPAIAELRDRLALETRAVETRAAGVTEALLERVAAMEGRLSTVGDLRDRVISVEAKTALPRPKLVSFDRAVASAVAPIQERVSGLQILHETTTAALEARLTAVAADATLSELRDRVVMVETKAALVRAPETTVPDLSPVLDRLAAAEGRLEVMQAPTQMVADLRDRVVAVETKAAQPIPIDPAIGDLRVRLVALETLADAPDATEASLVDLRARLAALEATATTVPPPDPAIGWVRDRMIALEARSLGPSTADAAVVELCDRVDTLEAVTAAPAAPDPAIGDLRERVASIETRTPTRELWEAITASTADLRTRLASLETRVLDDAALKECAVLRERIAVVETRAPIPGPPGAPGPPGTNGVDGRDAVDGKDGSAGLSFEGVYQDGRSYEKGHLVTWAGSSWHCNEPTTTKPGDGSKAWTLMVKRGRDGKDGRDAPGALPVVKIGDVHLEPHQRLGGPKRP